MPQAEQTLCNFAPQQNWTGKSFLPPLRRLLGPLPMLPKKMQRMRVDRMNVLKSLAKKMPAVHPGHAFHNRIWRNTEKSTVNRKCRNTSFCIAAITSALTAVCEASRSTTSIQELVCPRTWMVWVGPDGMERLFQRNLLNFGQAWPLKLSHESVQPRNVNAIHQGFWTKVFSLQVAVCGLRAFFFHRLKRPSEKKMADRRLVSGEESISNIPVMILTFELDLLNPLLCYFAGCMRWTSRFWSQMFLSSCFAFCYLVGISSLLTDNLVRLFFGLHVSAIV